MVAPITDGPSQSGRRASPIRRSLANLGRLASGKAAAGVLSLVYLVIVTHSLGAREYGILVLVNAYATTCGSLLAFSGFHGVVRYGAMARAENDLAGLARIVRFMALVEVACGAAAILVAAAVAPLIGPHLGWSPQIVRLAIPYSLAIVSTVRATPQGVLQLADRFDLIALHQLVAPVTRIVGVAIAWAAGGTLIDYLLAWFASSLCEGVAMWLMAWVSWRALVAGETLLGDWRGVLRRHHGFGRFALMTNLDITLREFAPNLMPLTVGWMLGPAAAGVLTLALRATTVLKQPAQLLSQASYAVLADLVAEQRWSALRRTVWRSTAATAALAALLVALVALVGNRLLMLLGGSSFAGAGLLVVLVTVARGIDVTSTSASVGLTAIGRSGSTALISFVANFLLYPLLLVALLWLGQAGAGWYLLMQGLLTTMLLTWLFAQAVRQASAGMAKA